MLCITLILLYWDLCRLFAFLETTLFSHINAFRGEVNPQFFKMLPKRKQQCQVKFSSLLKTVFYVVQLTGFE